MKEEEEEVEEDATQFGKWKKKKKKKKKIQHSLVKIHQNFIGTYCFHFYPEERSGRRA